MVLELEEILGLDGDHCPFAGLRPFFTCKRGRKDMFIAHLDRSIACMKLHLVRIVPHRIVHGCNKCSNELQRSALFRNYD